jgi:branched-chain amino acid transport system permease protein
MDNLRPKQLFLIGLLTVVIAVLPPFIPSFASFELTYVGAYAIAILGLVILTGMNGQISLGHGAFLAVGGYTVAILAASTGIPYIAAILIAGVICGIVGIGIGLVALRLEGVYLALATFALAVTTPSLLKHFKAFTGGTQGIVLTPIGPPAFLSGVLTPERWLYYLTWIIVGVVFLATALLLRGRTGRALRALRDNEIAAISFGVDSHYYKTLAFAWSAAYAGIAGGLLAFATAYVSPDVYTFALSLSLLTGAVIGGISTPWGALLGGVVVVFFPLWAEKLSPAAPAIANGVILILVMIFMPFGVAGAVQQLLHRFRRGSVDDTAQRRGTASIAVAIKPQSQD